MSAIGNDAVRFGRSPGIGFVFRNRRSISENRVHDPPRLFHALIAREQRRISANRITEKPLVGRPAAITPAPRRLPADLPVLDLISDSGRGIVMEDARQWRAGGPIVD